MRRRTLSQSIDALNGLLNSEIEFGQHVGPAKPKHEEHLCRPAADAFHPDERIDHLLVRQLVKRLDRQLVRRDAARQIFQVRELLAREPDRAESLVRRRRELRRVRRPLVGGPPRPDGAGAARRGPRLSR